MERLAGIYEQFGTAKPPDLSVRVSGSSVEAPTYTLQLPAGWRLTRAHGFISGADQVVPDDRYEDGAGNFFRVAEWGSPDGSPGDVNWSLDWKKATRSFAIHGEGRFCRRERCEEPPGYQCDLCEVGDGKFHASAHGGEDGPNVGFYFGNERRETGVDLAPFRALIRSFRAKPQRSAP